jgi:hypothetical protein
MKKLILFYLFLIIIRHGTMAQTGIDYWDIEKDSILIKTKNSLNEVINVKSLIRKDSIFFYNSLKVFLFPEILATYTGGEKSLKELINGNLESSGDSQIRMTVYAYLLISDSGKIETTGIKRGCGYEYDLKVIDLINKMPPWDCAYYKNKPVNSLITIPVNFTIR